MSKTGRKSAKKEREDFRGGKRARVRGRGYQPSKAELEEDVSIDASPEEVLLSVLNPVKGEESKGKR